MELKHFIEYPDNMKIADRLIEFKQGDRRFVRNAIYNPKTRLIKICAESASDKKERFYHLETKRVYSLSDIDLIIYAITHEYIHDLLNMMFNEKVSMGIDRIPFFLFEYSLIEGESIDDSSK